MGMGARLFFVYSLRGGVAICADKDAGAPKFINSYTNFECALGTVYLNPRLSAILLVDLSMINHIK
jgi:hypothetical protein